MLDRRAFLKATAGAAVLAGLPGCGRDEERWQRAAFAKRATSRTAILSVDGYRGGVEEAVRRGVELFDLSVRGRRVILKPNFVEFDPDGVINTHPAVVAAAIEVFRGLGSHVVVAEGPGHRRDNEYLLTATGIGDVLRDSGTSFVDLNNDAVRGVPLRSGYTGMKVLYLPETVMSADLFVSLPKMKTHHWVGVTGAMKNLYGTIPGTKYGWPKNVLHYNGIPETVYDINASLPRTIAIVDGIDCMEGDGPIMGTPRHMGLVVVGTCPAAVDATLCRLMQVDPFAVPYLALAANRLSEIYGGFVVVEGGRVTGEIALPVAGLMSLEPYEQVRDTLHHLRQAAYALGSTLQEPFLQLAFLPLPVIPHLKISDKGLVDVDKFELMT